MSAPFQLIPFPGPTPLGLVAGLTPPTDARGVPLDLADPRPCVEAVRAAAGVEGWPARWVWQVHGTEVERVDSEPPARLPKADALITDRPGVLLLTRHGDCPPVLFWDPARRAVGLAHSGRRGTIANVVGAVVGRMAASFGSEPTALLASLGPGIRACCYDVGDEVAEEVSGDARRFLTPDGPRWRLDLQGMIAWQLREARVCEVYGESEAECTRCGPSGLHSHRRGVRLRFAAVAGFRA